MLPSNIELATWKGADEVGRWELNPGCYTVGPSPVRAGHSRAVMGSIFL